MARGKKNWSRRRFLRDASLTGAVLTQRGSLPALHAEIPAESITSEHVLFFDQPAATWPDALPVGNGRLGAMVFGNPAKERLQLNEETVWMGRIGLAAGLLHHLADEPAEHRRLGLAPARPCRDWRR